MTSAIPKNIQNIESSDNSWDEENENKYFVDDNDTSKVFVKALYKYDGIRSDELTFEKGERIINTGNRHTISPCKRFSVV